MCTWLCTTALNSSDNFPSLFPRHVPLFRRGLLEPRGASSRPDALNTKISHKTLAKKLRNSQTWMTKHWHVSLCTQQQWLLWWINTDLSRKHYYLLLEWATANRKNVYKLQSSRNTSTKCSFWHSVYIYFKMLNIHINVFLPFNAHTVWKYCNFASFETLSDSPVL